MEHPLAEQAADAPDLRREEAPDPRRDVVGREERGDDDGRERDPREVDDPQVRHHRGEERGGAADDQQGEDDEDVEERLGDDDPDGPRKRHVETLLHEVAPVQVAELRRRETVHEPPEHQDLEEVAAAQPQPALAQEPGPASRAQREGRVVDDERREDQQRVRRADGRERGAPIDVPGDHEQERERDEDRERLAPAEQLAAYGELVAMPGLLGELLDRRVLDMAAGWSAQELFVLPPPSPFLSLSYRV